MDNKEQITFTPILVGVYDRHWHLKQCIESLQACPEAKNSVLYIASDAAYKHEDLEKVRRVRDYIESIDGFKQVVPILREKNVGAIRNYEEAITEIFKKHESLILMEDDVLVGTGFLFFMDRGLCYFREDPRVIGISGYLPPNVENSDNRPFILNRFAPYGMAIWKNKSKLMDSFRTPEFFDACFRDFNFFKEFEKFSPHCVTPLPLLIHGGKRYADIETGLIMQRKGLFAVYPPKTITKSIGHDGSGLRSGSNPDLQSQSFSNAFFNVDDVDLRGVNREIAGKIALYRRRRFHSFINYTIYFFNKHIPFFNFAYIYFVNIYKSYLK